MQLGDGRPQKAGRLGECFVEAGDGLRIGIDVFDVLTSGQDVLQSAVVKVLSQLAALPILGCDHLGEQARAMPHQSPDRRDPRLLEPGEGDTARSQPRQGEGAQEDRRPGLLVRRLRDHAHGEVYRDGRNNDSCADSRT